MDSNAVAKSKIYKAVCQYLCLCHGTKQRHQNGEFFQDTQFVVIVPTEFERDKQFIEGVMRPLLIKAGWVSDTDRKSKLLFFGQLEAALYVSEYYREVYGGKPLEVKREMEYLACTVQRSWDSQSVALQLDIIQMKFDKNYIAASRKSIASSKKQLLAPEFLATSDKIQISAYITSKTLELPRYILSRIFPNSPHRISSIWGDTPVLHFADDSPQEWFLKSVILDLITKVLSSSEECVGTDILKYGTTWQALNDEEKGNLASINCKDIIQFLPIINRLSLLNWMQTFTNHHQFRIGNADEVIVLTKDDLKAFEYKSATLLDILFGYLQIDLQNAIYTIYKGSKVHYSRHPLHHAACRSGVMSYLITMIDLANTLKEPEVLTSETEYSNQKSTTLNTQTLEQEIIGNIPGYKFYVEAKITANQQIKLYLHQVIETRNGKEKSTLLTTSTTIASNDMKDAICDALWNASLEYSTSKCASSNTYGHFQSFKSSLLPLLQEIFNNKMSTEEDIHEHQDIHIGNAGCSCQIRVSHKAIMDIGIKHYLNDIARSIIACVRSLSTEYKCTVTLIIITGSLLRIWTKLDNALYRDFIWKQLKEELFLSLYQHQLRVQLVMTLKVVNYFSDKKLIAMEVYRRAFSKKRFLVDIKYYGMLANLYEDKGSFYELIPSIEIDGFNHWRFALNANEETTINQLGIPKKFRVIFSRNAEGDFIPRDAIYYSNTKIYVCYAHNQHPIQDCFDHICDEALIIESTWCAHQNIDTEEFIARTSFPLAFTMGFRYLTYDSWDFQENTEAFSERLTVRRITNFVE